MNENETRLNISRSQLDYIPESFKNQKDLKFLDLSYNDITYFPEWFFSSLINLESLRIANNKLASIPESLGNLTNLEVLVVITN